jgi:hypothetical protein
MLAGISGSVEIANAATGIHGSRSVGAVEDVDVLDRHLSERLTRNGDGRHLSGYRRRGRLRALTRRR